MGVHFKIGEMVILRNDPTFTIDPSIKRLEGEEVKIASPLKTWRLYDGLFYGYKVRHSSIPDFFCAPHELHRKPPRTTGEQIIRSLFNVPPLTVEAL